MKIIFIFVLATAAFPTRTRADNEPAKTACMLPTDPTNGQYKVNRLENPDPNKSYEFLALNYTCNPGYITLGNEVRLCIKGTWSSDEPKCVRMCTLPKSESVEYFCVIKGTDTRPCKESEPEGTLVRPKCSKNYYFPGDLTYMHCIEGSWDYITYCKPVCGIFPTDELQYEPWFTSNGLTRVPWFATIYKKVIEKPYTIWCTATLVSKNVILTAGQCFWDRHRSKALLAEQFVVAVGTSNPNWKAAANENAQQSDLAEIIIHPDYPLAATKDFKNNIAVVKLAKEVKFGPDVRPVCLDFDVTFEQQQLINTKGLYTGWVGNEADQNNRYLKVLVLPYVPMSECTLILTEEFRKFITSDKICAGANTGKIGTCRLGPVIPGNSGGGIIFSEEHRGVKKYYLRGIVTLTSSYDPCKNNPFGVYTQVSKHEHFIKQYI